MTLFCCLNGSEFFQLETLLRTIGKDFNPVRDILIKGIDLEAKLIDFLLQNIVDRNLIKTTTCRQSLVKEMIYQDRSMTMKIQVQMMNLTLVQKPVRTSQTTLVSLTSYITLPHMYGLALSLYYIHDFPGICETKQCDLCENHYLYSS